LIKEKSNFGESRDNAPALNATLKFTHMASLMRRIIRLNRTSLTIGKLELCQKYKERMVIGNFAKNSTYIITSVEVKTGDRSITHMLG